MAIPTPDQARELVAHFGGYKAAAEGVGAKHPTVWRWVHPERERERARRYRAAHKDQESARERRWRENNLGAEKARKRRWESENQLRRIQQSTLRYAEQKLERSRQRAKEQSG